MDYLSVTLSMDKRIYISGYFIDETIRLIHVIDYFQYSSVINEISLTLASFWMALDLTYSSKPYLILETCRSSQCQSIGESSFIKWRVMNSSFEVLSYILRTTKVVFPESSTSELFSLDGSSFLSGLKWKGFVGRVVLLKKFRGRNMKEQYNAS